MINEATVNAFAARQLRMLRTTTGLSQTKLAREMGMSPQQVQKYEWGINRMSVGRVMQFAAAFDVPVATFFPAAHPSQPQTPAPPPTLRFIRLLSKIAPSDYDQLYVAMKAIAKLAERGRMTTINLDALSASDISPIFDALHHYLRQHGLALITDNVFLKPESLAKRWGLSISCLNNWRFTGGGPTYIKNGPGPKAQVRYPMLGENGVLMFERQRMYRSTAEESASIEAATSQLIPSD